MYFGFAASMLVLGWFFINYYSQLKSYNAYTNAVERTYKILTETQRLENYLKDAEAAQRGFLLTEDSTFLQPYFLFLKNIETTYDTLIELTRDNSAQKKNLKDLKLIMTKRMEYLREGLILFKSENKIFKSKLRKGRDLMNGCRAIIQKIENEERRLLIIRNTHEEKFKNTSSSYSFGAFIFAFIIFVITFLLIIKELRSTVVYQRQLEQKIEELNNSNQELEQIAFVASHDFQEPLRKIITFSDLLKTKYLHSTPDEGQHIFERVAYSCHQLKEVLDGLVNFTTSIRSDEHLQMTSLDQIIKNVLHRMRPTFSARKVDLTIVDALPSIACYPKQVHLLFECIFNNAIKFSKADRPVTISISTRSANADEIKRKFKNRYANQRYLKISIQDYGIGFQNEYAQKIFVLFQRLHTRDSEYEGRGIGLSVVKRIMHNHHGYVNAEGALKEGATFHLFFPV